MSVTWRQYLVESDELAAAARGHAQATAEYHRQLVDLYGKAAKTTQDWTTISQLIITTRAGYDRATVLATLANRAAVLADTMERTEHR